jgi:CRP-like cAMP-binding protein
MKLMTTQEIEIYSRTLSHSQLFHGIEAAAIESLVKTSTRLETPPGASILKEEDRVPGLHLLVEGSAQILKASNPIAIMGRGAFFGEISLFGVSFSATAEVRAKDKTISLVVTKPQLDTWGKLNPAAEKLFLQHMCTELCRKLYSTSDKLR